MSSTEVTAAVGEESVSQDNGRKPDPDRTKREILNAARAEFAEKGFSGARVDEISARTRTAKRMIYYYFGSKDGLYMATLEQVYSDIRAAEAALELDRLAPADALGRLIDFTFDYDRKNRDFVRIVAAENINDAKYLKQSDHIRGLNRNVLHSMAAILERGYTEGIFRREVDVVDLHLMISGLCFFRVSNGPTFSEIFGCDLESGLIVERHKRMIREAVLSYLRHAETDFGGPEELAASPERRSILE